MNITVLDQYLWHCQVNGWQETFSGLIAFSKQVEAGRRDANGELVFDEAVTGSKRLHTESCTGAKLCRL